MVFIYTLLNCFYLGTVKNCVLSSGTIGQGVMRADRVIMEQIESGVNILVKYHIASKLDIQVYARVCQNKRGT